VPFTHPRVDAWDEQRRRAAFDTAHEVLASVWQPEYRRSGSAEAQAMTTLIWAGDYEGAVELAGRLAGGEDPEEEF
jgi:hypothetical protein